VDCDALRDDQWERLEAFVPGGRKGKRGPRTNNRRFRPRRIILQTDLIVRQSCCVGSGVPVR
jgi:hypothetical protein